VPLKVKIKKEKEEKALDLENKNWFRDIEIEVTNTSDKPIYFLSMHVIMPDVRNDAGVAMTFPLMYGRVELHDPNARPLPEDIPIEPNTTHVFTFEETFKVGYEAWRNKNNKNDPMKLEVWIGHLMFGDGTGFTSMSAVPFPPKKDPDDLGRCLEKPRPPDQWSKPATAVDHPALSIEGNNDLYLACYSSGTWSNADWQGSDGISATAIRS
jgi:hypothetical protein